MEGGEGTHQQSYMKDIASKHKQHSCLRIDWCVLLLDRCVQYWPLPSGDKMSPSPREIVFVDPVSDVRNAYHRYFCYSFCYYYPYYYYYFSCRSCNHYQYY